MMSCNWSFGCYFNRSISQWCSNVPLVFQNYSIVMVQICLFNLIDHIYPKECSVSIICVKFFYLDLYYVFYKLLFTSCVWFKKPKPPFPPKKPNQTKKGNKTSTHKNPAKKPRTKTPQNSQHHLPLLQSLFLATRIFYALSTTESSSWLSLFRISESTFLRKHADGFSTSSKAKGFYPVLKVIPCVTGTVLIFFFLWNTEMLCLTWLLAEKKKGSKCTFDILGFRHHHCFQFCHLGAFLFCPYPSLESWSCHNPILCLTPAKLIGVVCN